ncbi:MAG: GNAT family N-acetyltransferase, partial [Lachnospiraceae bacterium]|nr:GNAT family N-acetyltransferase [Lachnospiraceae bacterium]
MTEKVTIRQATEEDAKEILSIYEYYVKETAITFEYEVPTEKEFCGRIKKTLLRYPYLVAEMDGKIVGYSYLGPLKERAAYDWSAETTIYIEKNLHKKGVGRKLYEALEEAAKEIGIK